METAQVTTETIRNERPTGGSIPEVLATWIAANAARFIEYETHDTDTGNLLKMSKKGMQLEDAEEVAWLLWRARMVLAWTAVNRKPTITWAAAVESAWLKDVRFENASAKRKAFYAEQTARRDRLANLIQTGTMEGSTASSGPAAKAQSAAKRKADAKDAAMMENLRTTQ